MNEHEKTMRAKERVESMIGFYVHLAVFVAVMTGLFFLNYLSVDAWWVQWPLLGWGLGVLAHALLAFGRTPQFVKTWRLRKIKQVKDTL